MNIANLLTIVRIFLAFIVFYFMLINKHPHSLYYGFVAFLLAVITDYLDGLFARKRKIITNFGKVMDPIADKLLVILTLASFAYLYIIQIWIVVVIALREIIVTTMRLYALIRGRILAARGAGKYKAASQMIGIVCIFIILIIMAQGKFSNFMVWMMYRIINSICTILVIVTLVSGIIYVKNFFKYE